MFASYRVVSAIVAFPGCSFRSGRADAFDIRYFKNCFAFAFSIIARLFVTHPLTSRKKVSLQTRGHNF